MSDPAPTSKTRPAEEGPGAGRWGLWILLLAIALALVVAAWMLMRPDARRSAPGAISAAPPAGQKPPVSASETATAPAVPAAPSISPSAGVGSPATPASPAAGAARHPIERVLGNEAPMDPATASLDAGTADKAIASALGNFPGKEQLMRLMLPSDIVRRVVLTIDNLPADSMSMQYRAVVATPGSFMVERRNNETAIAARNATRYDGFVEFAASVDSRRLVALYKRFYPLLQKTYQDIGYPDRHFNDRVIQAIDDMLSAPSPAGPVLLDQPRVLYEFSDSSIERRSVGQRMLVRLGPQHSARLKTKLREIRALLTQEN